MSRRPSDQTNRFLAAMLEDPLAWRYGYELLKKTGLQSGTLYPLLIRLSDQGLLEAQWREPEKPGKPPRHVYRLTPDGLAFARGQVLPASRTSEKILGAKA
jgi:PadR family transcriptional regulator, regulatory protein PadR